VNTRVLVDLGVSLTVPNGQIGVIVGPSGSGKTTVLRCIAGFRTPGCRFDRDQRSRGRRRRLRRTEHRRVGYVPQEERCSLISRLLATSGSDSIVPSIGTHGLRVPGDGRDERFRRCHGTLRRPATACRTRTCDGPVPTIVMDEPFSALDAALRQVCADVVAVSRPCCNRVPIVTHDRDEALLLLISSL